MSDDFEAQVRAQLEINSSNHPGEDEETVWLLSYADLMTLLFTFFVMLYATAQMDDGRALRNALITYLQGNGGSNEKTANVEAISDALKARLSEEAIFRDINIAIQDGGLKITFSSNLLFELGSAELRPALLSTLREMVKVIKEKGPDYRIRIEGHTDDVPIQSSRYRSNWELSGARAAYIAGVFEDVGFPAKNLLPVGYGSSRPMKPNRDPAGVPDKEAQRQNRRVVLTVYSLENLPVDR